MDKALIIEALQTVQRDCHMLSQRIEAILLQLEEATPLLSADNFANYSKVVPLGTTLNPMD